MMTTGRMTEQKPSGPLYEADAAKNGELLALAFRELLSGSLGSLGDNLPGIMDELRAALSPLQALRPDYGDLPDMQAALLRQVQVANSRADLSRASPALPSQSKAESHIAQKGART